MYSEDPETIKDAYEFLLDDTTGNFYQRCDAKLNHLRDSASRLQAELITIQSEASIAKTIDHLSAHINEFSNVAKDILYTLRDDGELINLKMIWFGKTDWQKKKLKTLIGIPCKLYL